MSLGLEVVHLWGSAAELITSLPELIYVGASDV